MATHTVQMVHDDEDIVDFEVIKTELETITRADSFRQIDVTKHSKIVQKEYNSLRKRYVGVSGAESKYIDPELVDGYALFDVAEPPYNMEALGILYDESSTLHAVIDSRVMNTVGLGFIWEPTLKARKQIERASLSVTTAARVRSTHQKEQEKLNEIFDSLNEEETFIETMIRIWLDTLSLGNGYMEVGRTAGGKIGYIGHVPAATVRVRKARDGFVQSANQYSTFFRNFGDSTTKDPVNGDKNPNEMLHFKMYTPNNSYYGVPPSISALPAIMGDKFAKEYNIDYFENKAIPRYAIVLKGVKISEKGKKELIQYFRNEIKGKNHGTLVVPIPATVGSSTEADIRFEKLEAEVQEASFDKYRKSNRDEIITSYRVPPTKVGVFEDANLAVSRDADKTFKSQVVGPDQVMAEKRINRIVKEFTDLFRLKFSQLDVIDEDMKSRIHDRYARIEVMTPNEIRAEIGLQPIVGGDFVLPYPVRAKMEADKAKLANDNANQQKGGEDNIPSNSDENGTASERGQQQDSGNERDRSNEQ